jgi:CRP-like cAMP-binding protein
LLGKLDKTVKRQLAAEIKHEIYMPGAHIVRTGDACGAIYFIKKGEIVVLDESPGIELCVEILYEDECFGEVNIFPFFVNLIS